MKLTRAVYQRDGRHYVDTGVVRPPRRGEKFLSADGTVGRALGDFMVLGYSILRRVRAAPLPFGFYLVRGVAS